MIQTNGSCDWKHSSILSYSELRQKEDGLGRSDLCVLLDNLFYGRVCGSLAVSSFVCGALGEQISNKMHTPHTHRETLNRPWARVPVQTEKKNTHTGLHRNACKCGKTQVCSLTLTKPIHCFVKEKHWSVQHVCSVYAPYQLDSHETEVVSVCYITQRNLYFSAEPGQPALKTPTTELKFTSSVKKGQRVVTDCLQNVQSRTRVMVPCPKRTYGYRSGSISTHIHAFIAPTPFVQILTLPLPPRPSLSIICR